MSDFATQYDDGVFEPDEETLISALRNQDDIPILMDIVADRSVLTPSQEEHMAQSFNEASIEKNAFDSTVLDDELSEPASQDVIQETQQALVDEPASIEDTASSFSQEHIAQAIASVLEKRLPELVAEVVETLQSAKVAQKSNAN